MATREQAEAVQRMQTYIETHLDEPMTLEQLAKAAGYSPWRATRLFKDLVGIQPSEYLRARRLSRAAMRLRDTSDNVLDVALDSVFQSHEGFTRAFSRQFGMTPEQYRKDAPPIPLFMERSARHSYDYNKRGASAMASESTNSTIFVQVVERPARKLIVKSGLKATEYWAYCEEIGCDIWGILTSIKGALFEPIGMWMPENLRKPGTSTYTLGVEVPADYSGPVPEGMGVISLPPCKYMVFHGPPYNDEDMGDAIGAVSRAMKAYKPETYGWQWADEDAPRFQMQPRPDRGYIEARPVTATK